MGRVWSAVDLDGALRLALADYSRVRPIQTETVLTLAAAGREIALSDASLAGINGVQEVWWPYSSTAEIWPPNRVAGFRVWQDGSTLVLFLSSKDGSQPQSGDKLRLWWTKPQTITGLDSATSTTLSAEGESLVILGAAGYAAITCLPQGITASDTDLLRKWGAALVSEFKSRLEKLRLEAIRTQGEPFGAGWKMDKWDVQQ